MHVGDEAEAGEHRRPHVTQPQARTPHVVVPEDVTPRKDDIHPEHMTRAQEHATTTGATSSQATAGGL